MFVRYWVSDSTIGYYLLFSSSFFLVPGFWRLMTIVHRDTTHWRNEPVLNAEAGQDRQILWGQLLHRSRAGWVRTLDCVIVGYFFLVFGAFFLKAFPNDPYSPISGSYLPAHVATFFLIWLDGVLLDLLRNVLENIKAKLDAPRAYALQHFS
jgi:hypothetical protein